jgi:hypothetical protein
LEDTIETAAELGVVIVDEEAQRLLPLVERHRQVARLLCCPGRRVQEPDRGKARGLLRRL